MDLPFDIDDSRTSDGLSDGARRFRKHFESGRYVRPLSSHKGIRTTLLDKPICALDGEGKTRTRGNHDYTLMCAVWPASRRRIERESLTPMECFDFLLSMPEDHTYVGYGLSYDTNMWCRGLPKVVKDELLDKGKARWRGYNIRWIERKFFSVSSQGRSITVYDVIANWQVTFVAALEAWNVGTPEQRAIVARMKAQRGNFDAVLDADIEQYCYLECELLIALCRKLFDAILETPYRPRAVYGPGALASAAMEHHGVKRHLIALDEPVATLTRHAYFGGRFDCSMFGWFTDIFQYDIKSAYPHHIRFLPCLKHAQWTYEKAGYERIMPHKWGLYHVEWCVADNAIWTPFPHRKANGNVYYPYLGSGWYHASEVDAALAMYGSDQIRITEAWHMTPGCDELPFSFVDSLYALRKKLESEGGYDQGVVIKLILNSLYGKLAQQVGTRRGKPPPFQCFYWAGAITAGTRAMILSALADNPHDVIGIATDSLVSMRELDFLPLGGELGEWDYKHLSEYMQISNGVYHGLYDFPPKDAGKTAERARGLGRYVLDWARVKADFQRTRGAGSHVYPGRSRFITIREARQRLDAETVECRWIGPDTPNPTPPREIDFTPARRMATAYNRKLIRTTLEPFAPNDYGAEYESQPFRIKTARGEVEQAREKHNPLPWLEIE